MTRDISLLSCCLNILPWFLVLVGVALVFVALTWRDIAGADDPNGPMLAIGIVLIALAFAISCMKDRPKKQPIRAEQAAPESAEAQLPFVSI